MSGSMQDGRMQAFRRGVSCLVACWVCLQTASAASGSERETLEQALGDSASPLDAVAIDIEQQEYQRASDFLEGYIESQATSSHRYHDDLARPWLLLGDARLGLGDNSGARAAFARAVHISRLNHGLFTPRQIAAVYREADALSEAGELDSATDREEYAFEVLQRAHDENSEALLPGIARLANWYETTRNMFAARVLYQRAMNVHLALGQENSMAAVPTLRGLANTYRQERFPPWYVSDRNPVPATQPGTRSRIYADYGAEAISFNDFPSAERALQQVIKILQQTPDTPPEALSRALMDLADWHLLWEHFSKAHTLYEFIYQRFDSLPSGDSASRFAEPVLLHLPLPRNPRPPSGSAGQTPQTGLVAVRFNVSKHGQPTDLEVVRSEPDGMMDFAIRRSLRSARYRPVLLDGKISAHEGVIYEHEFTWFPKPEAKSDTAPEAPDANAGASRPSLPEQDAASSARKSGVSARSMVSEGSRISRGSTDSAR